MFALPHSMWFLLAMDHTLAACDTKSHCQRRWYKLEKDMVMLASVTGPILLHGRAKQRSNSHKSEELNLMFDSPIYS